MSAPCVYHSPPFHPKFESLSDEDLDICEIVALAVIAGLPQQWSSIDLMVNATRCFQSMSKRQKREYEVAWALNLTNCTTDALMRNLISTVRAKTTKDERDAALTGLRSTVWARANCP